MQEKNYVFREDVDIECKEAKGGLPKDLWETYSSFANTSGGSIYLGVKEKDGNFTVSGIDNVEKILKDFWDNVNNPNKVSINILNESNVQVLEIENKKVIEIKILRADRRQRPVYIGENPFNEGKHSGTFRRNYEGDYKCSKEEIKRMIADQLEESQDSLILEGFDITDLSEDTINRFKNGLSALKPHHPWILLDLKTFLCKLGAYAKDRKTGKEGITAAGLLMFGEESSITDEFPKYFLDYREIYSEEIRWDYRVISSDGTWSGNLFDFYYKIINKITDNLNVPFRLVNGIRQEDTRVHKAVREAVANALIHADYRLPRGIVIERGKTYFKFSNPGTLRITLEEALKGGISDPRNKNIFKMFNLLGIGERAGSGLENIQLAWKEQEWTVPDLEESYGPDRVTLTLRTVSILPKESIEFIKLVLKEEYKHLSKDEIMALVTAQQEGYVTNNRLQQLLDTHALESNKILSALVEKEYLKTDGIGRGTKYYLTIVFENSQNPDYINEVDDENDLNKETSNSNIFEGLNNDEIKIVQYIIEKGSITNKECREQLGFGKTKSIDLFNKLKERKIVKRIGAGARIKYTLENFNN